MLLALAPLAHPEIIDRIAVSVGNRVITVSDILREIRVISFLDGVKPDLSVANQRATAGRMVEQKLIRRELETNRYPLPETSEIQSALDEFKKRQFATEQEYQRALESYGITEQEVKEELLWQRTLLLFIEMRFRPGVQVSDQEIQGYFEKVVEPAAKTAHPGEPVSLEDYRDQIEERLAGERVDKDMDAWLKQARDRTEIVFHEEAFQ
jgi:peptidyl-prolyl cis-trans isomerase SurA